MLSSLSYILPFLAVLSVLVFVHEFGHFIVARWCKVTVEVFSVGFGPVLLSFNDRKGTQWRLSLIPLGGFVRMRGEINPADDDPSSNPGDFGSQPLRNRVAIIAAGPLANFLFAMLVYAVVFATLGKALPGDYLGDGIGGVVPDSPAESAGLQAGDVIVSVARTPVGTFAELAAALGVSKDDTVTLEVARPGTANQMIVATLTAHPNDPNNKRFLGVEAPKAEVRRLNPFRASVAAGQETMRITGMIFSALGGIFVSSDGLRSLGGPITIAKVSRDVSQQGLLPLLLLSALLSINLGLINLLPIPILDGGHLVLFALEAVRGSPLRDKARDWVTRAGLAVILAIMALALFNDFALLLAF